jgi:hypothetical protein
VPAGMKHIVPVASATPDFRSTRSGPWRMLAFPMATERIRPVRCRALRVAGRPPPAVGTPGQPAARMQLSHTPPACRYHALTWSRIDGGGVAEIVVDRSGRCAAAQASMSRASGAGRLAAESPPPRWKVAVSDMHLPPDPSNKGPPRRPRLQTRTESRSSKDAHRAARVLPRLQ